MDDVREIKDVDEYIDSLNVKPKKETNYIRTLTIVLGFVIGLALGIFIGVLMLIMALSILSEDMTVEINLDEEVLVDYAIKAVELKLGEDLGSYINNTMLINEETQRLLKDAEEQPEQRDIGQTEQGEVPVIERLKGVQLAE